MLRLNFCSGCRSVPVGTIRVKISDPLKTENQSFSVSDNSYCFLTCFLIFLSLKQFWWNWSFRPYWAWDLWDQHTTMLVFIHRGLGGRWYPNPLQGQYCGGCNMCTSVPKSWCKPMQSTTYIKVLQTEKLMKHNPGCRLKGVALGSGTPAGYKGFPSPASVGPYLTINFPYLSTNYLSPSHSSHCIIRGRFFWGDDDPNWQILFLGQIECTNLILHV